MTVISKQVLDHVLGENQYAHDKWGDKFDNKNTLNDWVTYITMYATDAARMDIRDDAEQQYALMVKAANLALCCATRLNGRALAPRHYDTDRTDDPANIAHGKGRAFV
jgi:hypothetical protein